MARQQATKVVNQFVNGLITENTALSFPEEAAVETFDCVFDRTGRVTRRDAFDVEAAASLTSIPHTDGDYITEYLWETVGGVATKSFLVLQTSNILRFYDVSTSTGIAANVESFTIDLDDFIPQGSSDDPAVVGCQYAAGDGNLVVTNPASNPISISYVVSTDSLSTNTITLKYRDLVGVNSNLGVSDRVTGTEANLFSVNPNHYYNIVNQGWFEAALDEWDTDVSAMPSNSDAIALFRSATLTEIIDVNLVNQHTDTNSSPAPKGHFILDVFTPDRVLAVSLEGLGDLDASSAPGTLIAQSEGVIKSDLSLPERCWDGNTGNGFGGSGVSTKASTDNFYLGKDYGSSPKTVLSAQLFSQTSDGYVDNINPTVTVSLRGSQTLPSDWAANGTQLGTANATDSGGLSFDVTNADDITTEWRFVWFYVSHDGADNEMNCTEMEIYTPSVAGDESLDVTVMSTTVRPQATAFYASRIWYAGVKDSRRSSNIYFSQLLKGREDLGKCYQENDPTSEDVFDLIATDGGVIEVPELGDVQILFSFQDSLLIFANNGIWQIKGGTAAGFSATNFIIRKISSIGIASVNSLVDVKGVPVFWADQGIYSVTYDFENDSFQAKSLTDDKIKTFITDIPEYNRQWVKGVYNIQREIVTFIYNDSATLAADNTEFKFTKILNLDTRTGAFYPWTIGDNTLDIRGIVYVRTANRAVPSISKLLCFEHVDASNEKIGFAEQKSGQLLDWTQYAIDTATASEQIDYTSYFESGYLIHAEAIKHFQATYINVFMEVETYAGLKMKGIFDFSNSTSSNKEGTLQQCYNDLGNVQLAFRDVSMRKLKIRGKGRSLSLRYESESERPFTLIGWSIYETANASI